MVHGINEQIKYIIATFLTGLIIGFLYDFLRARRKLINFGNICVNIEDILFCVSSGFLFLTITFYFNSGDIRIGGFFCVFLGILSYFFVLRNRMVNLIVVVTVYFKKLLTSILKIIAFPVKIVVRLFKKPIEIIIWYTGGGIKKTKRVVKTLIFKQKKLLSMLNLFIRKH